MTVNQILLHYAECGAMKLQTNQCILLRNYNPYGMPISSGWSWKKKELM